MLIEFSVQNFRSIREMQTLSFIASPIRSKNPEMDHNNSFLINDKTLLLKSLAIYGANGSGKSNVIKALNAMLNFIKDSMRNEDLSRRIFYEKYNLNADTLSEPLFFQLQFILKGKKYRYGFEINNSSVTAEWLYGPAQKKEIYYFKRENNKVRINSKYFPEGLEMPKGRTSETNLFLNVAFAYNGILSKQIKDYFVSKIYADDGSDFIFRNVTSQMLLNDSSKKEILDFLNLADFGINDIYEEKFFARNNSTNNDDLEVKPIKILKTTRSIYDLKGEKVGNRVMWMNSDESEGTNKMYNYSGIIIDALLNGKILILDEFDASLHPVLTKKIVQMFNSSKLNKKNAQLVFVTHDTHLLDNSLLRRDQIYFTEKNTKGETMLYSLVEINGVRNDSSFEKDYIKGKYGAIPFIGDFDNLFDTI
jgi:uncharacterized protein